MSRGKRYNHEPKLNIKKVVAVVLMILVIIAFVVAVRKLVKQDVTDVIRTTEYYTFYEDNRWGVIDSKGNVIVEPIYSEMIIIPDHTKDVFICTENVDYDKGTYTSKVLNAKNKQILKAYKQVEAIENYDKNNDLWYEENVLKYRKDNKVGLINLDGKVVLEANYEELSSLKGSKGVILTKQEDKIGLVSTAGKEIIPTNYIDITSLGENTNLYIVENENKQYGIYNTLNEKYQEIKSLDSKEYFCVKEDNQYKVINKDEDIVFDQAFDRIIQIKDNILVYQKNKEYKAYDLNSRTTLSNQYDFMEYTSDNYFIVKKNNAYGIVTIDGMVQEKIKYASIDFDQSTGVYELEEKNNTSGMNKILNNKLQLIAEGILEEANSNKSYIKVWTEDGSQYYNLEGEPREEKDIFVQNNLFLKKENGKYGYVDKNGTAIVECIYDDAKEQNAFGYAAVKKDGKWGAIDSKGNIVCEIKQDLDDYLLIDFIKDYHLGRDINLMYYTK